jgi:haloalkane dehalogenase
MEALELHLSRQLERSRDFFWNRLRWELVYEDLATADRVVDVGAGPGFLGEYLAARRPGLVRGLVLLETFLRPMTWAEYPPAAAGFFRTLRTPGEGERMALEENFFIETSLRRTTAALSDADLDVYRAMYPDAESRRALLQWPREIPLDGEPADVRDRFLAFGDWLAASADVPKLLLTVEPGQLVSPAIVAWAREHVAALEVESVGAAGHHAPEDQPDRIGAAVAAFLARHRLTEPRPERVP